MGSVSSRVGRGRSCRRGLLRGRADSVSAASPVDPKHSARAGGGPCRYFLGLAFANRERRDEAAGLREAACCAKVAAITERARPISRPPCRAQCDGDRMRFDLTDLRLFAAVAACGNITKAAESLPIAVAAASSRIRALEESVAATLLSRHSRGVELTPAGEVFLQHTIAMLRETTRLRHDLSQFGEGMRGNIRLFANTNAIHEFLPALLARFLAEHPGINVDVQEHTSPETVRAVDEGGADLGIIVGLVNTRRLEVAPFRDDRFVVIVPHRHALAGQHAIRFHQVLEWNFIGLNERSSHQQYVSKTALLLGQNLRLRTQVESFEAICHMVAAGVGVSIVPESTTRRLRDVLPFSVVDLDEQWSRRALKLVSRAPDTLAAPVRKLLDALVPPG
ncbi:LysR family transcriptional regulator [Burkholderia sp. Ap-962]|nr:LysR family transcriptional regulator [Burkholderia sp. Ap-962]